jgi:hypothetical protein
MGKATTSAQYLLRPIAYTADRKSLAPESLARVLDIAARL